VLEFDGRKKAVAFELPRLFAPLLLRVKEVDGAAVLSACLHNSVEPVVGLAKLTSYDLATGERLGSAEAQVQIEPESSIECARLLVPAKHALWVGELGDSSVVWHSKKQSGYQVTDKQIVRLGANFEIVAAENMIDVRITDLENPENSFEPNFFTLLAGGRVTIRASMSIGKLDIRCLDFSESRQ